MLSFKSSAQRHPFIAFVLSIGSLLLVHSVTIAGHEYVNHTNPEQTILYTLDAGLENVENFWAKLRGKEIYSTLLNAHLLERIDELEHVIEYGEYIAYIPKLFDRIKIDAENNHALIATEINQPESSINKQSTSLEFESTVSEARKRLDLLKEKIFEEAVEYQLQELLVYLEQLDDELEIILADLDVQIEQETIIKTTIEYVPVPAEVTSTGTTIDNQEINTESCASSGDFCSNQADCCVQTPQLYCQLTTGTSTAKRCLTTQQ